MEHTFKELKKKKVKELREIAAEIKHEAVQGYTQLNKEHLLEAICKALGIDLFEHHKAVGLNKAKIKGKIKELKKQRDEATSTRKMDNHRNILSEIHRLKRRLHKATV